MRCLGELAGAESTASTLRGLRRCQYEFEAASVDLLLLPPVEMGKWICKSCLSGEGASLDLLAAAYQQRVLWAEAHADSSFRRIIAMMAGFFGPPANQDPVI